MLVHRSASQRNTHFLDMLNFPPLFPLQYSGLPVYLQKRCFFLRGLSWNGGSAKRTKRCCNISTIPILRIARYKSEAKKSKMNKTTWNLQKTNMEPENQPSTKENHLSKHLKKQTKSEQSRACHSFDPSEFIESQIFRISTNRLIHESFAIWSSSTSISPHQFRT